ncbi:MAG: FAD-dependent oxidoreductase [Cyanobacteria bacterium SZAS TMP-1]|nr:FAD-dependent oxidoreductase [Cyanobacteria bacterium SZAS TMP-1]
MSIFMSDFDPDSHAAEQAKQVPESVKVESDEKPLAQSAGGNDYEVIVLGGGKGGKTLAQKLGRAGRRVLLIEKSRAMIGGSCINVACIPTKAFITAARYFEACKKAGQFGIVTEGVRVDWKAVRTRVMDLVSSMREMNLKNFENTPNLQFVVGEGKFCGKKKLEVRLEDGSTRTVTAPTIIINTGARPQLPDTPGLAENALTSETIQQLQTLPEHLIVMGSGYIGLEFAQVFKIFGSKVTVIDRGDQIISREDADVSQTLAEALVAQGIVIESNTRVESVEKAASGGVVLHCSTEGKKRTIEGSHLLVALGRLPNTEVLDLGVTGVFVDKRGFVKVDDKLQSSCEGIYALGDVNGGPQFTHISFDDHRIVTDQLLGAGKRTSGDRQVPFTLFTEPELARVGLTEKQALEENLDVEIVKVPMSVVPRARVSGETAGFMKAVLDRSSGRILGCTILGADAGNLLAVVQMAMLGGLSFSAIRDAVFSHPTMPEGLNDLFAAAKMKGQA